VGAAEDAIRMFGDECRARNQTNEEVDCSMGCEYATECEEMEGEQGSKGKVCIVFCYRHRNH
jgi:hypothetical protein